MISSGGQIPQQLMDPGVLSKQDFLPDTRLFIKGPFKNDVTAKMRFLDPPPSLVTICHYFGLPPSPLMSPVQTVTNH